MKLLSLREALRIAPQSKRSSRTGHHRRLRSALAPVVETLRSRVAAVLNELVDSIEHVGSTAVPGLAAKPIIDIDVLFRSSSDLPAVIHKLAKLGYEYQGALGVSGREAFRTKATGMKHYLYVCPPGSREYDRHIAFRNHLREHAAEANAYALLKRELATRFGADREGYNQAKSEFVEHILCRTSKHSRTANDQSQFRSEA